MWHIICLIYCVCNFPFSSTCDVLLFDLLRLQLPLFVKVWQILFDPCSQRVTYFCMIYGVCNFPFSHCVTYYCLLYRVDISRLPSRWYIASATFPFCQRVTYSSLLFWYDLSRCKFPVSHQRVTVTCFFQSIALAISPSVNVCHIFVCNNSPFCCSTFISSNVRPDRPCWGSVLHDLPYIPILWWICCYPAFGHCAGWCEP
jgi:hypothetical protein